MTKHTEAEKAIERSECRPDGKRVTFKQWLLGLDRDMRDDVVTDLAKDAQAAGDFPEVSSYSQIYVYMCDRGACDDAIRAFRKAWLEWLDKYTDVEGMRDWGVCV